MAEIKKKFFSGAKLIISLAILVILIVGVIYLIDYLSSGQSTTPPKTKISALSEGGSASWVGTILLKIMLGMPGPDVFAEDLALYLAVFIILLFAFGEILNIFSMFTESTAWIIAFALSVIAGVTGLTSTLAVIFSGAVALGTLGIVIILVTAFLAAATLHIGIGKTLRTWRINRQIDIEGQKSGEGAAKVEQAITSLKGTQRAYARDEE